jgi:serine protease DegS
MRIARILTFVAQSIVIGLAVAFLLMLLRPGLFKAAGPEPMSFAAAVTASAPAIVNIYTAQIVEQPLRRRQLTGSVPVVGRGLGSGVVVSESGYVVTNWHVVRDADEVRVQLADGRVAAPTLVGADPETELALLKIDLDELPTIALGRSDTLESGDVVLAIGNSFGLSQTVTQGIVSATGRGQLGVALFENFIQTDAAINIGNSGGALVNTRGELVGINTAVVNATARNQEVIPDGIGFAIPVNLVRGVMDELIANGRVIRGYLGVDPEPSNLTPETLARLGIDGGVALRRVLPGPAVTAGLAAGDILVEINGRPVTSRRQAMNQVASGKPGDTVELTVWRDGRTFQTSAVLEERPPEP